jgi:4-amino-4-deoxy-L-arabinose transferase-like glycosyltransferase
MTISCAIRQTHRWIAILFTLTVVAGFIVPTVSPGTEWVYYLPLAPLAVLMFSGLYLFAQPYLGRQVRKG